MNAVAEASTLLRTVAEPRPVGDSVKLAIDRAARRVSRFLPQPMQFRRAEDIWRQEARTIKAEEMDAIRAAAGVVREAKNELADLRARIARCEAFLRIQDEDFHSETLDAMGSMVGPQDRPLDR